MYLGFDGETHFAAPGQTGFYSDMSIWDIFRSDVGPHLMSATCTLSLSLVCSLFSFSFFLLPCPHAVCLGFFNRFNDDVGL